jgi:hypothetical protein
MGDGSQVVLTYMSWPSLEVLAYVVRSGYVRTLVWASR